MKKKISVRKLRRLNKKLPKNEKFKSSIFATDSLPVFLFSTKDRKVQFLLYVK